MPISTATKTRPAAQSRREFSFDAETVDWYLFCTPGTHYRILSVDLEKRQADMLGKFEPDSQYMLEGELRIRAQVNGAKSSRSSRPAAPSAAKTKFTSRAAAGSGL